eukprot:scaffold52686_cov74-Attheya_sp.AAC.1
MAGADLSDTQAGDIESFSEEELNDEAFENMMGGSFRMPESDSAAAAAAASAHQEEEDYDMDDELAHLSESEEALRQELDSFPVAADPAVTSRRLSSTIVSWTTDAMTKIIQWTSQKAKIDASKENTGNLHHRVAELTSLLEEIKREIDAAPPRAQDHDYKDEAVTGARQSETRVSSSGIDAFSDEEEAQNSVSRENTQAEDGCFEPMKDTFSLMFICNIKSLGFAYSVFFFALQVTILILICINALLDAPDGNPLKVPVGTSLDVIGAQVLALLVSLITQSDFMATFDLINVKFDDTVLSLFEGATHTKWIVSNLCRFIVGVFSIAISFIFIVQSTTVLELFFNFAAVQFVSELDNIAFQLAYKGYMVIGDLEQTTRKLIDHVQFRQRKMFSIPGTQRRIPVKWVRISIFTVHAVILYTFWSVVRNYVATGQYLDSTCLNTEVNFGDKVSNACTKDSCPFLYNDDTGPESTVVLPYGPFSGIYEVYRDRHGDLVWKERRPVYYRRNHIEFGEDHPGKFFYCTSAKAWVFTIDGVNVTKEKAYSDECNWLLRSPETEAYLLADAPTTEWSIWTNDESELADPHFELSCGECESEIDCSTIIYHILACNICLNSIVYYVI